MKAIFRPKPLIRRVPLQIAEGDEQTRSRRGLCTEWILTNALGGYASGTIGGVNTRRFHGWLIAALAAPHGRTMMVNSLRERFLLGEKQFVLDCEDVVESEGTQPDPESNKTTSDPASPYLEEFRLESGLPVWIYRMEDAVLLLEEARAAALR